jgi:hypothetical protein
MKRLIILVICIATSGCTRNVAAARECAPEMASRAGFEIIGPEGYTLNPFGGFAWYAQKRIPDNGVIYEAAYATWFGQCQMYDLKAVDAIKP